MFCNKICNLFFLLLTLQIIIVFAIQQAQGSDQIIDEYEETGRYVIEGKVYSPEIKLSEDNWQQNTRITINGGDYMGYLRDDGGFIISNVPSGSYVLEIINPDYYYESVRIQKHFIF